MVKMRVAAALGLAVACALAAAGSGENVMQPNRVLFLAPISSKSHKNLYMGVAEALADRGNQVTLVSPFRPSKTRENLREILVPGISIHDYIPNLFTGKTAGPMALMSASPALCSEALAKEEVQDLLKEKFDVVLLSMFISHCFLSIVHKMQVPYIWVSPAGPTGMTDHMIGNPSFPSFTGFVLLEAKHPLSFTERALSVFGDTFSSFMMNYLIVYWMDDVCRSRGLCPDDMPSLNEMQFGASLLIQNHVRTLDNPPRPFVPNVIAVGGIHCRPAQPLPPDLEEWVQGAGEAGFIFFSLGSAVIPSDMPEEYRQILVKVFGSLKQRVLWKWDREDMPDMPPNVRLGKWLPQQDILGHESLRLFITHGGQLSTMESTYHGIPVLGLPVMGDQQTNMVQVAREGWGKVLFWDQLSEEALAEGIRSVMGDRSMREEAKRRSRVMKDQPQPAGDVASYWVNYVIRHKGAPHLRSPVVTMPWYQVYNVDVWMTTAAVAIVITYLLLKLLAAVCARLCSSKGKRKRD
ncbi:UDP-glucosyltransferase 2-like isoform X1 [Penaeus chinensis]|uniref:UDP-glucosyltransferase 2-like isoform X1 n=1 Tax=Penaeus chinensis TaxID=139456 RepID=UPI001FB8458A|nr:UDP-glucosyltransferase 2-like isoform X1 [Penaeus chinensis]